MTKSKTETCENFIEIRFYGLMRSGNHAIINWVQDQYEGEYTCFLNNVMHNGADPFTENTDVIVQGVESTQDVEELRERNGKILMYSYEDRFGLRVADDDFLKSACPDSFEENREKFVGKSRHKFDVMIIRDPFNCLASRYRMIETRGPQGGESDMRIITDHWKSLAREAVALKNNPSPTKVVINYNRWVEDQNYRRELSRQLLGTFNDSSVDKVAIQGGGSSFPETTVARLTMEDISQKWRKIFSIRRIKKMGMYIRRLLADKPETDDFFQRWQALSGDESYQQLFRDPEILTLSEALFGELSGTREFVRSLQT